MDGFCSIIFTGNGNDITSVEMQAWVDAYVEEARRQPIGRPLIVDFDLERANSRAESASQHKNAQEIS